LALPEHEEEAFAKEEEHATTRIVTARISNNAFDILLTLNPKEKLCLTEAFELLLVDKFSFKFFKFFLFLETID